MGQLVDYHFDEANVLAAVATFNEYLAEGFFGGDAIQPDQGAGKHRQWFVMAEALFETVAALN